MKLKSKVSVLFLACSLLSFNVPKNIQKKINKEIKNVFNVESFDLNAFVIPSEITKDLPSKFEDDNLFKIESNNELLGYAYLAKAPSKTALFDYLVLLDSSLVVVKTKVLIYREEYGGEIGSKRWLKQFIGKTQQDQLVHGGNIVGISGATISVRSMTNAMNDFLKSIKILHSKHIF